MYLICKNHEACPKEECWHKVPHKENSGHRKSCHMQACPYKSIVAKFGRCTCVTANNYQVNRIPFKNKPKDLKEDPQSITVDVSGELSRAIWGDY